MPVHIAIHTGEGKLRDASYSANSLEDAAHLEPPGIYTVARTYHSDKIVLRDAHFERLKESAHLEGIPMDLDQSSLMASLRTLIKRASYTESRFRITIPRDQPQQAILSVEPLQVDSINLLKHGVEVATLHLPRGNPRAKSNEWVEIRAAARQQLPSEVYEGIRVSSTGYLKEGFSSNFYAIKEGTLHTSDEGILYGIARRIALNVTSDLLSVDHHPVNIDEIPFIQEIFLTSISRGVVPILKIDGIVVGDGSPGPMTLAIMKRYDHWVKNNLEPI